MRANDAVIDIHGLTKSFGRFQALRGLDIHHFSANDPVGPQQDPASTEVNQFVGTVESARVGEAVTALSPMSAKLKNAAAGPYGPRMGSLA